MKTNKVHINHDCFWISSPTCFKNWDEYKLAMLEEHGLEYIESCVFDVIHTTDTDVFEVVDVKKFQLFVLKHSKYIYSKYTS